MLISSLQNPKIKEAVKLRERRHRDKKNRFIIEGYRENIRAVQGKQNIETLFICPELFLGENEASLIATIDAEIIECTPEVFHKISYRDRPDGLLSIAVQTRKTLKDLEKVLSTIEKPFLVVAESIEKPGNLGTILRTSDAAGVDALIVCDQCTDVHNPNVVRASVGTLFTVPVFEAASSDTITWLKEQGISIAAATPKGDKYYTEADFTKPTALAFGTEQLGLSEDWFASADEKVLIPMKGEADSLNVAMATGILLYEVLRQRSFNG